MDIIVTPHHRNPYKWGHIEVRKKNQAQCVSLAKKRCTLKGKILHCKKSLSIVPSEGNYPCTKTGAYRTLRREIIQATINWGIQNP
jgi:hypothetical protein